MKLWLSLIVWSVLTFETGQTGQVSQDCAKIATFNAALLAQRPHYETRKPLIPGGLSRADSDVYCLQEVWLERDIEYILNNVDIKEKYPYHYSPIHAGASTLRPRPRNWWERFRSFFRIRSACSYWDRFYLTVWVGSCAVAQGCMEEYEKSGLHGTACLAQRCSDVLSSPVLKNECVQCLMLFSENFNEGGEECMPNRKEKKNRLNAPGLMLLSKKPLSNVDYTKFYGDDRLIIEKGYLEADVEGTGKVICTHLTNIFPLFMEYDSDYDNYHQMQRNEMTHLIETFHGQEFVLVGDFNAGPGINATGVDPEFPENYQLLDGAGYTNPYASLPGQCTFCKTNEMANGPNNALIDHIFINGESLTASSSTRIMDDRIDPPYSDHYGVEVNVCRT